MALARSLRLNRPLEPLLSLAAALWCALCAAPAAAQDVATVGRLEHVQGEVRVTRGTHARKGDLAEALRRGDRVETGPDARAAVQLADGSRLILGPNALMIVEEAVPATGRQRPTLLLQIPHGAFRLFLPDTTSALERSAVVRTSAAVVSAARGEVWAGNADGGWHVLAIHGRVQVRNSAGSLVLTKKRTATMVTGSGQAPGQPKVWERSVVETALTSVAFD